MKRQLTRASQAARRARLLLGALWIAAPMSAFAFAYVANQGDGTLSLIDTVRDKVTRTLPNRGKIGTKIQAVATDVSEKTSFVVDALGNALVAVDLASGEIKQRIQVGTAPEGASLSPSGNIIAVCVEDDNSVTLVDVEAEKVTRKIPTQGKNPEHCVFSSDGRWLMTSNENSDDVDLIDLEAGRSVARIHTSGHPRGIAWLPNRPIAYVAEESAGGVDVIDVAKRSVIASIPTGLRPAGALASLRTTEGNSMWPTAAPTVSASSIRLR